MHWNILIFTVITLKTLHGSPYGHQSFPVENHPFFPGDSSGFHPPRSANHHNLGAHGNEFWNPHFFPHNGPTVHGPQIDINLQSFTPADDIPPFEFENGPFDNRPSRENFFPRPQQPRRTFNNRPNEFFPSRDEDSVIGRPNFSDRPSRQRPFNGRPSVNDGSTRQNSPEIPQFGGRPNINGDSQNFPGRPQPGRPFNERPNINLDPSRQDSSGRPSSFIPFERDDGEEVFIFDKPTSKRPPTTRQTTTTTTTTPRNCDCPSTPEFNPVCGTNGQTYSNPGKLKCAVICGTDVRLGYYGSCITTTESPPSTTVSASGRNRLF